MTASSDTMVDIPLCVDLDGTLVLVDTFHEACIHFLKRNFFRLFFFPLWALHGKSYLKQRVSSYVEHDLETLPVHPDFLQFLKDQKSKGRRLFLVTAAPLSTANAVSTHLQLFDGVLTSSGKVNMKGRTKAQALLDRFGYRGFDYAGNAHADVAVWKVARRAILVQPSFGVRHRLGSEITVDRIFPKPSSSLKSVLQALRPHQLVKNLLIFIPLVSSHTLLESTGLLRGTLAFIAFSACTSAVYLFNDLFDIVADRRHTKKRLRPIARGS